MYRTFSKYKCSRFACDQTTHAHWTHSYSFREGKKAGKDGEKRTERVLSLLFRSSCYSSCFPHSPKLLFLSLVSPISTPNSLSADRTRELFLPIWLMTGAWCRQGPQESALQPQISSWQSSLESQIIFLYIYLKKNIIINGSSFLSLEHFIVSQAS